MMLAGSKYAFFRKNILYPVVILLAGWFFYQPVLDNQFSGLDDYLMIEDYWHRLTEESIVVTAFTEDVYGGNKAEYYRPLLVLGFVPDALLGGTDKADPGVYFMINLLWLLAVLTTMYFFLGIFGLSPLFRLTYTLLYLVHPFVVPAVAWIPGRNDLMLSVAFMLFFWSYHRFRLSGNKPGWMVVNTFLLVVSLLLKETAVTFPVIVVLYDVLMLGQNPPDNRKFWIYVFSRHTWKGLFSKSVAIIKRNRVLAGLWILVIAGWFLVRAMILDDLGKGITFYINHLLNLGVYLIDMFGFVAVPLNLSVFMFTTLALKEMLIALPGVIILVLLLHRIKTENSKVLFGTLWIVLLTSVSVFTGYVLYQRLLLPFIGFAVVFSSWDSPTFIKRRRWIALVLAVWAIFLIYQNRQLMKAYDSRKAFWTNAVRYAPETGAAQSGMAWVYHLDGRLDSAVYHYNKVLEYSPDFRGTRISLAIIYEQKGQPHIADSLLMEEYRYTVDSSIVDFYYGQILAERGDTAAALPYLIRGKAYGERSLTARQYYDTVGIKQLHH